MKSKEIISSEFEQLRLMKKRDKEALTEYYKRRKEERRQWIKSHPLWYKKHNKIKSKKLPYLPNYATFLQSPYWKNLKERFFIIHERRCWGCGLWWAVHLHHATYKRMGVEQEGDLVPLCAGCHSEIHRIHKEQGGDLYDVTHRYLDEQRQVEELYQLGKTL